MTLGNSFNDLDPTGLYPARFVIMIVPILIPSCVVVAFVS